MRELVPRRLLVVVDVVLVPPQTPPPPPPLLLICVGGGFKRDGSNNDGTLVCFLTGVRLGDDLRLLDKFFNIFALKIETNTQKQQNLFQQEL